MSLDNELEAVRERSKQNIAPETRAIMEGATAALQSQNLKASALKVGDRAPEFSLTNARGETVHSRDLLSNGPLVLNFYRGGWCPYCNLELRAYLIILPELKATGAQLAAISPMLPDASLSAQEKNELEFHVLSDVGNRVAGDFGLVFQLSNDLKPVYQNFGIDLPGANGDDSHALPVPATYVIDPDGTIAWAFVDEDYTRRAEPADVLAHLNAPVHSE